MIDETDVVAPLQAAEARPLDGLVGRDRLIEFAALRCAAVDDVEWEALLPLRKERYRDMARAVFMTLPHHIGGQLWQYIETGNAWSEPTSGSLPKVVFVGAHSLKTACHFCYSGARCFDTATDRYHFADSCPDAAQPPTSEARPQ